MQNGRRRIGARVPSANSRSTNRSESFSEYTSIQKSVECPICGIELPNLQSLNDHIDITHISTEEETQPKHQDFVNSWFSRTINGATTLHAKAAQRLLKLEPYEQNGDRTGAIGIEATKLTDSVVTREHWQAEVVDMKCHDPTCDKILNFMNGRIHCRKCGYVFCNFHTLYQAKLSVSADYDPEFGFWSRICRQCYENRPGYNDVHGQTRSRYHTFEAFRKSIADKRRIEFLRLDKRMKRLESLWSSEKVSVFDALLKNKAKKLEQEIVNWQEDSEVETCPECGNVFTLTRRRRHCRLCGRVVCRFCVLEILHSNQFQNLLICNSCNQNYFKTLAFQKDKDHIPGYILHINHLQVFRHALQNYITLYKENLADLLSGTIVTQELLQKTKDVRQRFSDLCLKYESTVKKISSYPVNTEAEEQIKHSICAEAKSFLQETALHLQAIPRLQVGQTWSSQMEQDASARKEEAEKKQNEYTQMKIVIEEQVFLVENMIREAKLKRKFSEVDTLVQSLKPLQEEIQRLERSIQELNGL
ncbi:prevacuole/endosomal FYVE tethering component Pep7 [Schizosaccharomyces cryophilus OY26]|uniref:Prevacuole/endosomal FYVE tethering component Pep7 n=1 Tax=Schizosaccharomyces cryophilus (strain OY26 / ATCC MYA-4695 / CBS 11777 / NBRC 106824 / NRRL Y48691) TaxID=653667 RepID=S9XGG5_SCHCR|nr:prevacuole/endosomal FYVE tethering component Pep7 [Schizosaccharomyces cryophilus OY26]EPY52781.1 prevacuole/endosomal FYVE tethering component Pep7 [Schizosaccharomyces cryophilus OY26]